MFKIFALEKSCEPKKFLIKYPIFTSFLSNETKNAKKYSKTCVKRLGGGGRGGLLEGNFGMMVCGPVF